MMKWRNEVLPITTADEPVSATRREQASLDESIPLQPDPETKQHNQQQVIACMVENRQKPPACGTAAGLWVWILRSVACLSTWANEQI